MGRSHLAAVAWPAALLGLASSRPLGPCGNLGVVYLAIFFGSPPPVACFCSSITASSLFVDRGLVSAGYSEGTLKRIKLPKVALALRGAHPRLCRAKPAAQVH